MIPQLFFGQRDTPNVLKVDVAGQSDAGVTFTKLARTNRYAPGEETIFRKVYITVTWEGGPINLLVTPYVDERAGVTAPTSDGIHLLAQTLVLPAVTVRTKQEFEVAVVEAYRYSSQEQTREHPRGKWVRVELSWTSTSPVLIEGVDMEVEVVRESLLPTVS